MREEATACSETIVVDGGDGRGGAPDRGLAKRRLDVALGWRWPSRCVAARLGEALPAGGAQRRLRRRWSASVTTRG
jgi:hypothetical protein